MIKLYEHVYKCFNVKCEKTTKLNKLTFNKEEYYTITPKIRRRDFPEAAKENFLIPKKFDKTILTEFLNSENDVEFFRKHGFLFAMSKWVAISDLSTNDEFLDVEDYPVIGIDRIKQRLFLINQLINETFNNNKNTNYLNIILNLIKLISYDSNFSIEYRNIFSVPLFANCYHIFDNLSDIIKPMSHEYNLISGNYNDFYSTWSKIYNPSPLMGYERGGTLIYQLYKYLKESNDIVFVQNNFKLLLYYAYNRNWKNLSKDDQILVETLYNCCFRIKEIEENLITGKRTEFFNNDELISINDIDKVFISKLKYTVEMVLTKEINDYFGFIQIIMEDYNGTTPKICVGDLIHALYYTIFIQLKEKNPVRKCIRCGRLFNVDSPKSKKEYCSTTCKDSAAKARQRLKSKKKE